MIEPCIDTNTYIFGVILAWIGGFLMARYLWDNKPENAVVPQVAQIVGEMILEMEVDKHEENKLYNVCSLPR